MSDAMFEFGAIGFALMIIWRLTGILQYKWTGRQIKNGDIPMMTPLACQVDPQHFQRIINIDSKTDTIRNYTVANEPAMRKVRDGVGAGTFSCVWKDRDEVLMHVSAMRELTKAMNALTVEIKKQNGR